MCVDVFFFPLTCGNVFEALEVVGESARVMCIVHHARHLNQKFESDI